MINFGDGYMVPFLVVKSTICCDYLLFVGQYGNVETIFVLRKK
jgi:hypothetical protein